MLRINPPFNHSQTVVSCNASKGAKLLEVWLESDYCKKKEITVESIASVVKKAIKIYQS